MRIDKTKSKLMPERWNIRKLGELVSIKSGDSPSKYELQESGETPYIKVDDLNNCNKYQRNSRLYARETKDAVPKNSVLFAKRGAAILNNKVRINTLPVLMDSNMMAVASRNDAIEPEFLYYTLIHQKLFRIADTSTIPQINNKHINPYKILLPPLPEQQKIAAILGTWDEAIQKCEQTIAALKTRNKGLAQQLLSGKKRLPAFAKAPAGKKGFEGEWEELPLSHFFTERNERGVEGLPLLSIGESGVYPQDTGNKKDTSNKDKSKYKRICPNDIGYNTMRMWQGRSALSTLEGIVSPAYTIVKPKNTAHPEFFARLFKTTEIVHRFFRNSQGLVSDTLNCKFKDFKIVKAFVPTDLKEQEAITKVLNEADRELQLYQQKLTTLKDQKKGLMQKLLTGEVRVNVENH